METNNTNEVIIPINYEEIDEECSICYENNKNLVNLECKHKFCLKCYHNMIKNKFSFCPFCRLNISEMESVIYYNDLQERRSIIREEINVNNMTDEEITFLLEKYKTCILCLLLMVMILSIISFSK